MSKTRKGFPASGMPAEEAEETLSRIFFLPLEESYRRETPSNSHLRLSALIHGFAVGSAERGTRLSIRPLLQESKRGLGDTCLSSAQLISVGRIRLGKLSFRLSGLKQRVPNCATEEPYPQLDW